MSVHVVHKRHIDFIVTAILEPPGNPSPKEQARMHDDMETLVLQDGRYIYDLRHALGMLLLDENVRSVLHHCNDPSLIPEYAREYRYEPVHFKPTHAEVFKAIGCYEQQSRESPGWKDSTAYKIITRLREFIICTLPGYDEATWEWTDRWIARRIGATSG